MINSFGKLRCRQFNDLYVFIPLYLFPYFHYLSTNPILPFVLYTETSILRIERQLRRHNCNVCQHVRVSIFQPLGLIRESKHFWNGPKNAASLKINAQLAQPECIRTNETNVIPVNKRLQHRYIPINRKRTLQYIRWPASCSTHMLPCNSYRLNNNKRFPMADVGEGVVYWPQIFDRVITELHVIVCLFWKGFCTDNKSHK